MSGTSLDGIDLAHCTFTETAEEIHYQLGACETIPYDTEWKERFLALPDSSAHDYALTHAAFGRYSGERVRDFIRSNHLVADFVSSHGHTIFHNPAKGYTSQIGEGAALAIASGLPVVCDFRTTDVAAGGQGAPLVPIGDELLFGGFTYCLNLGGFANISAAHPAGRIAFDICPANILLNHLARHKGLDYDDGGRLAASGKKDPVLLNELNNLAFYQKLPPKSLGREWTEEAVLPLLKSSACTTEDLLHTFTEHIAHQVAACTADAGRMLVTGGGAMNTYLMERISALSAAEIVLPDTKTIHYKEALIFALLGLLRMEQRPNCMPGVTGARQAVCGGAVYLP
jgi:anhydro-N-acetylmuramic acid kinase